MAEKQTILEFIEEALLIPQILTTRRTTESRHQLRLLARTLRRRLGADTAYLSYEKGTADRTKATIEEGSIFDTGTRRRARLFVLEGFARTWAEALRPPPDTYILAEVDDGLLQPTPYSLRRSRDVLKVLTGLLEAELGVKPGERLSLRALLKLEWESLNRFEEYESLLRKAYLMGWDEERTGRELSGQERTNILTATKRSDFKAIFGLIQRLGHQAIHSILLTSLADTIYYRALKQMGFDEDRIQREMGTTDRHREELEEAARTLTADDVHQTAERAVRLDSLVTKHGALGLETMLLNAPIRVRK